MEFPLSCQFWESIPQTSSLISIKMCKKVTKPAINRYSEKHDKKLSHVTIFVERKTDGDFPSFCSRKHPKISEACHMMLVACLPLLDRCRTNFQRFPAGLHSSVRGHLGPVCCPVAQGSDRREIFAFLRAHFSLRFSRSRKNEMDTTCSQQIHLSEAQIRKDPHCLLFCILFTLTFCLLFTLTWNRQSSWLRFDRQHRSHLEYWSYNERKSKVYLQFTWEYCMAQLERKDLPTCFSFRNSLGRRHVFR